MSAWLEYANASSAEREAEIKAELEARGLVFVWEGSIGHDDPVTGIHFATSTGEEGHVSVNWEESREFANGFRGNVANQLDLWLDPVTREQEQERQRERTRARWGNGAPQEICVTPEPTIVAG